MTIIVGIICKDAIVMASDSQTTSGARKATDSEKISVLQLRDAKALVAQSGSSTLGARAVEILEGLAKDKSLTDCRTVADLAQKAMRKLNDELRFQNCDCSMEELHEILRKQGLECELMLAHYFDGKPYLYTVNLLIGIGHKAQRHYEVSGCGGNLGHYLLTEHARAGMSQDLGYAVALYIVEQVKNHDAFCGGPTKIGSISQPFEEIPGVPPTPAELRDHVTILEPHRIGELTKAISKVDAETKYTRNQQLQGALEAIAINEIMQFVSGRE